MPVYEYECEIHSVFEHTQSINSEPLKKCPYCEEHKIDSGPPKRLISGCSFALKGSGWAADNYSK